MAKTHRKHDSSLTRVGPLFDAISAAENWVERLLQLPSGGHPGKGLPPGTSLNPKPGGLHWQGSAGSGVERDLFPPMALLSWLIRNLDIPPETRLRDRPTDQERAKLAKGDPATIEEGLRRLRSGGTRRGWHVLEGPSYPDAFVETPEALIVVEGKRTESGLTTSTTWMANRHQIWRHIDGAWEIRGRRAVVGIVIVEGEPSGTVPEHWRREAQKALDPAVIEASFPHRSSAERDLIIRCFWGVTTWQAVCRHFSLDPAVVLIESL